MEIFVVRNNQNVLCAQDQDSLSQIEKLPLNFPLKVKVTRARNYRFHKKFFKLISTAWDFQPENVQKFYGNEDTFRKSIQLLAGHYEPVYNITREDWMQIPKSISFDKMDETEFEKLYNAVLDVILNHFLVHLSEHELDIFYQYL